MSEPPLAQLLPRPTSIMAALHRPGLRQVFVHEVRSQPNGAAVAAFVPGLERYPERALLLARSQDVVCVGEPVDGDYLRWLKDMGLGPDQDNVIAVAGSGDLPDRLLCSATALRAIAGRLGGADDVRLNPFITGRKEAPLARALERVLGRPVEILGGNPALVERVYHKHVVAAKAPELDVPLAPGEIVELDAGPDGRPRDLSPLRSAAERVLGITGRVIIRGACGASACATAVVENSGPSLEAALALFAGRSDNAIYLVDAMVRAAASPNVQEFVPPRGAISCVSLTDQIIDGRLAHMGNAFPSRARALAGMCAAARTLSEWLRGQGFTGLVGYDFVEHDGPRAGETRFLLAEMNPRTNAAAYPAALLERLGPLCGAPPTAFLAAHVPASARSFAELRRRCGSLFLDAGTGEGMFPYNTGCLAHGKFTAAFLGHTREQVEEMHRDFASLPVARQAAR